MIATKTIQTIVRIKQYKKECLHASLYLQVNESEFQKKTEKNGANQNFRKPNRIVKLLEQNSN
jgi:hypothetical protein